MTKFVYFYGIKYYGEWVDEADSYKEASRLAWEYNLHGHGVYTVHKRRVLRERYEQGDY